MQTVIEAMHGPEDTQMLMSVAHQGACWDLRRRHVADAIVRSCRTYHVPTAAFETRRTSPHRHRCRTSMLETSTAIPGAVPAVQICWHNPSAASCNLSPAKLLINRGVRIERKTASPQQQGRAARPRSWHAVPRSSCVCLHVANETLNHWRLAPCHLLQQNGLDLARMHNNIHMLVALASPDSSPNTSCCFRVVSDLLPARIAWSNLKAVPHMFVPLRHLRSGLRNPWMWCMMRFA